jgi:hypothetical protein
MQNDRPQSVPNTDPRTAVVAVLTQDAQVLGSATVITQQLAITTAGIAQAADARAGSSKRYPILAFPQVTGRRRIDPSVVGVENVDHDVGFAVLHFGPSSPALNNESVLGSGSLPDDKTACQVFWYDHERVAFASLSGRTRAVSKYAFVLEIDPDSVVPTLAVGSPVFSGELLVGIVASSVPTHRELSVVSIAAMANSDVTPAIRSFLPWINDPSSSATPRSSEAGVQKVNDEELWARLSPSSRTTFALANGIRQAVKKRDIHTYHLIAGLYPSWKNFFEQAGVSEDEFRAIVQREFGTEIPVIYPMPPLSKLPPRSKNVQGALLQAAKYAEQRGSKTIWSADLLYGALSLTRSTTVRVLNERGVRREDIHPENGPDGVEILSSEQTETHEPVPPLTSSIAATGVDAVPGYPPMPANPTPKVASDLWSEADRLGYEAYARTIASLITHEETKPPLTIGIKAPWGAGKTSLMKRVQHLLDGGADSTERNDSGLKQMWQQSTMTFWSLLGTLNRKTIIVDPDKHVADEEMPRGRARDLLKDAVRVDAVKPKESADGRGYGISPRITVWFNAWKYQTSEQIWAGMAYCMISQITARMDPKQRELFWLRLRTRRINADEVRWRVWSTILRQVLPFAMLTVAVCILLLGVLLIVAAMPVMAAFPRLLVHIEESIPFAGILAIAWKTGAKLGEKAAGGVRDLVREPGYENKMGYLAMVEADIRDVLKVASVTSKQPLVVFVDDLDRCAPNKVAEVVEAINLFLCGDYPNCIFVLGMEPGMVAAALEVANKDVIEKAVEMGVADQTVPVGWRFMEKIVQLPITIPPPTKGGKKSYVESLTGAHETDVSVAKLLTSDSPSLIGVSLKQLTRARAKEQEPLDEEAVMKYVREMEGKSLGEVEAKSEKVLAGAPVEQRRAAAEASKRVYAHAFSERDPAMADFVNEVAEMVGGNPRQIKRYVNVFRFYSTLRHSLRVDGSMSPDEVPSDKVLAKFVALSIQWPHAVDCLRVKKDASGRKATVLELLELESRKTPGEDVDEAWGKFVGELGLGAWAGRRGFREFLASGPESLCEKEGHGLW